MATAIETKRGSDCSICHEGFSLNEKRFTHVGGERHDGFHKICLANWLSQNPLCPYDEMAIDRNSLLSRTERIMERLRPALVNTAYAALFGVAVALTGARLLSAEAEALVPAVAAGMAGAAVIGNTPRQRAGLVGALAAGVELVAGAAMGLIATAATAMLVVQPERARREIDPATAVGGAAERAVGAGIIIAAAAVGVAAALVKSTVETGAAVAAAAVGAAATAAGVAAAISPAAIGAAQAGGMAGTAVGLGINFLLNQRGIHRIARENIGAGMCLGGAVTLCASALGLSFTPLMTLSAIALIGGGVTGALSLIRRQHII